MVRPLGVSYRGYGGSTGKTGAGLLLVHRLRTTSRRARYPAGGSSSGASRLAPGSQLRLPPSARAPGWSSMRRSSAADSGASAYPFIPVRWFLKDSFRSDERIRRVRRRCSSSWQNGWHCSRQVRRETVCAPTNRNRWCASSGGHVNIDDHGAAQMVKILNSYRGETGDRNAHDAEAGRRCGRAHVKFCGT